MVLELIGWGMATETYPGTRNLADAVVRFMPDGRVFVASGTEDIGTGMYTIMTQVTADALQIPPSLVDARIGDTTFLKRPSLPAP